MNRRLLWSVPVAMCVLPVLVTRAELPPLIPREVFFGNPDKASLENSPGRSQ